PAYGESRHALLLESLMSHYGIAVPDGPGEKPRDAEWGFLRMGYGECFDSFFAFGLFHVAAESGIFPAPLVGIFDGVMQEEARHILFFANWVPYRRLELPAARQPWFHLRRGLGMSLQAIGRLRTALQLRDADAGDDFTMQVPESIGEVTLRKLGQICLGENERRLSGYDPRLLRRRGDRVRRRRPGRSRGSGRARPRATRPYRPARQQRRLRAARALQGPRPRRRRADDADQLPGHGLRDPGGAPRHARPPPRLDRQHRLGGREARATRRGGVLGHQVRGHGV